MSLKFITKGIVVKKHQKSNDCVLSSGIFYFPLRRKSKTNLKINEYEKDFYLVIRLFDGKRHCSSLDKTWPCIGRWTGLCERR
jgi:hypothetical protein